MRRGAVSRRLGAAAGLLRRPRLDHARDVERAGGRAVRAHRTAHRVPAEKILIENRSTNTGENVVFTKRLLEEKGIDPAKFILVQKPYMERRSYATFRMFWPEKELVVTSPQVSFDVYPERYANPELSKDDVSSIMVGDLQRIGLYPSKGFQIHQEIPDDVRGAYEELVGAGYDKHLVGG